MSGEGAKHVSLCPWWVCNQETRKSKCACIRIHHSSFIIHHPNSSNVTFCTHSGVWISWNNAWPTVADPHPKPGHIHTSIDHNLPLGPSPELYIISTMHIVRKIIILFIIIKNIITIKKFW